MRIYTDGRRNYEGLHSPFRHPIRMGRPRPVHTEHWTSAQILERMKRYESRDQVYAGRPKEAMQ